MKTYEFGSRKVEIYTVRNPEPDPTFALGYLIVNGFHAQCVSITVEPDDDDLDTLRKVLVHMEEHKDKRHPNGFGADK